VPLDIPGLRDTVMRHAKVTLVARDLDGAPFEIDGRGLVSRAIQHEVDHLEGMLFVDRLSTLKRQLLKRHLDEIATQATS
jgi:peptide deformylase